SKNRKQKERTDSIACYLAVYRLVLYGDYVFYHYHRHSFSYREQKNIAPYVTAFGLSVSTFGPMLSGLAFSRIYLRLKKWIIPVGLLTCSAGFMLTTLTKNSIAALVGLLFTGIGLGFVISLVTLLTANSVGSNDSTAALALVNSAFSVGIFVSPFFYAVVPRLLSPQPNIQFNFLLAGYFFLGAGIIAIPSLHFLVKEKAM
ncbi:MAG: hypothetical protein Q7J07_03915, partial [Pelolinea sp.]|nr:hypothetical protein [Pelolinea sp.]